MNGILIGYGILVLLSAVMVGISIRRVVRPVKGRGSEVLGLVLWGIVFAVLSAPVWFWTIVSALRLNTKPDKPAPIREQLIYQVCDPYGDIYYSYKGGKILTSPPGEVYDTTGFGSRIWKSTDDPAFPYYFEQDGKYYPLQYDHHDVVEFPES